MSDKPLEVMARGMQASEAWPAVFAAGSAEVLARAALAALEQAGYDLRLAPCPIPDKPGWTMRDCWSAKRCGCADGARRGYVPATMPLSTLSVGEGK